MNYTTLFLTKSSQTTDPILFNILLFLSIALYAFGLGGFGMSLYSLFMLGGSAIHPILGIAFAIPFLLLGFASEKKAEKLIQWAENI